MLRDYTDMMNMTPAELVRHALDCAKVGVISIALVEALAVQLEIYAEEADRFDRERADAEVEAETWREECLALQRQLDRTHG